jgi:hypothetical protein
MSLQSKRELDVTREKLRLLEQRYKEIVERPCEDEYVRDLTLQSFKRIINQMKEEIAVFECHASPMLTGRR